MWARGAAARGAAELIVTPRWNAFTLAFKGRPFTRAELEDPFAPLFAAPGPRREQGFHLALGLLQALQTDPTFIHVESGSGPERLLLKVRSAADYAVSPTPGREERTLITASWGAFGGGAMQAFFDPRHHALRDTPVFYGDRLRPRGVPTGGWPPTGAEHVFASGSAQGRLARPSFFTPPDSQLCLFKLGVHVCERQELLPWVKVQGWVNDDKLPISASQAAAVEGPRLRGLMRLVAREAEAMALAAAREHPALLERAFAEMAQSRAAQGVWDTRIRWGPQAGADAGRPAWWDRILMLDPAARKESHRLILEAAERTLWLKDVASRLAAPGRTPPPALASAVRAALAAAEGRDQTSVMEEPSSAQVGLALFFGGLAAVLVSWAWSKLSKRIPRMPRLGKKVVGLGRGQTSMADGKGREEEAVELASRVLAERWALERVIGRGGMGAVWEGGDRKTGRRIAIKTMEAADDEQRKVLREIYLSEARALSRLRHPNVVDFIEAVPDGAGVALVFAFVSGKTLQQMIAEEQRLTWEPVRAIFVPVARALAAAHAGGVVHRDMKPANVMVADDGIVKVMDFGVARFLTPDSHAPTVGPARPAKEDKALPSVRTSTLVGTPAYMPPEASQGLVTPRGDLFSTGVCLHEALTGRLPFGFDGWTVQTAAVYRPASELIEGLPPAVDALIGELLEPDPEKRLPDAAALERRLLDI